MKIYTEEEIKTAILASLNFVAPEIDLTAIRQDLPFRDQIDIDSLDFVRFLIHLHQTLNIEIPESDYSRLTTIDSCIQYIKSNSQNVQPHL